MSPNWCCREEKIGEGRRTLWKGPSPSPENPPLIPQNVFTGGGGRATGVRSDGEMRKVKGMLEGKNVAQFEWKAAVGMEERGIAIHVGIEEERKRPPQNGGNFFAGTISG